MHLSRRAARGLRSLAILSVVVTPFMAGARLAVAAGSGGWTQLLPRGIPAALPPYIQLQCPGVSVCYALGNPTNMAGYRPVLEDTADGGATWHVRQLSVMAYVSGGARPLSCPSVSTCYLLAATGTSQQPHLTFRLTTDGGTTWTNRDLNLPCAAGACDGPLALDFPSVSVCYAIAWSFNRPPAVGMLLITRDAGASWSRQILAGYGFPPNPTYALACPGVNDCYLSGMQVVPRYHGAATPGISVTHDGGKTWREETMGKGISVVNLACPGIAVCFATAIIATGSKQPQKTVVLRVGAGGRMASIHALPHSDAVPGIACATTEWCVVAGGVLPCNDYLTGSSAGSDFRPQQAGCTPEGWLYSTSDGGLHWRRQINVKGGSGTMGGSTLLSASCPSATQCYAAGYLIWAQSGRGGAAWSARLPERFTGQQWIEVHRRAP